MVRNNIELDVKIKCLEAGITQQKLGETIGTTGQYVNRIVKKKDGLLNDTFVKIVEALGYDIEFTYVKRESVISPEQRTASLSPIRKVNYRP